MGSSSGIDAPSEEPIDVVETVETAESSAACEIPSVLQQCNVRA